MRQMGICGSESTIEHRISEIGLIPICPDSSIYGVRTYKLFGKRNQTGEEESEGLPVWFGVEPIEAVGDMSAWYKYIFINAVTNMGWG